MKVIGKVTKILKHPVESCFPATVWPHLCPLCCRVWRRQMFSSWFLNLFLNLIFTLSSGECTSALHWNAEFIHRISVSSGDSLLELTWLNRRILSLNISWISSSLAGCQTLWLACVCVSCSRDDAVRFMCWQRLTVSSTGFCESREVWSILVSLMVFLTNVWGDFRDQTFSFF